jgi:hypothetical protein
MLHSGRAVNDGTIVKEQALEKTGNVIPKLWHIYSDSVARNNCASAQYFLEQSLYRPGFTT